ncbi:lipoprotein-anchoring transpeptidase ErfK/SrfK [Bacillus alveayuensis]|uniref:Lipoprotein-anchoring transpeptidase ErfK/SrfK n=2 Tax=Aeribacillus alveayuensis TaxID=279215 RepID=A0ABT9VKD1_9BACI|nr:lipoprotein-anchoring transpeptidase ErfK/SrfK [Bacillus alveayuensis]
MKGLLFICLLMFSPIWPLGQNPLPGDPFLIVNKKTNKMAYIENGDIQKVYTVATGKTEHLTPVGTFTVTVKAINPYYRKKNIPGGSPQNPLGSRWIGFDALGTDGRIYGIHGTNAPSSIGQYITNGCVRLRNDEVEELFERIPLGTKVLIVNEKDRSFEELGAKFGAIKKG